MVYDLRKFDESCSNGRKENVRNSCGIKIHEAQSCGEDLGSEYYATDSNPWVNVTYGNRINRGYGRTDVEYGYSVDDTRNRVLVLYDSDGHIMTCDVIDTDEDKSFLEKLVSILTWIGAISCCICLVCFIFFCGNKRSPCRRKDRVKAVVF